MKNKKLNFSVVFTSLAIVISVAANANALGSRTITACYENFILQNASGSITYSPATSDLSSTVNSWVVTNQVKYLKGVPTILRDDCNETARFCCAHFTEAPAGTPATVPTITINGVTAKWVVHSIVFHN
ncbi:hypothetical protein [Chitinophaga rhizosphaerae]|uniref:hypothetical protein n=1 Tax=Chitinophaga rhizosphaerae TaxID=1864947 RepID=UPI000F81583D|nr:hypothetical protein [Chitinophaga rhizosphaerae]